MCPPRRAEGPARPFTGMPSVMHTTIDTPASAASRIASAANRGGTKIIEVFAPVSRTASATVSKTGTPSTRWTDFPGRHAGAHLGAGRAVPQRVEGAFAARDALDDELRVGADEHAHAAPPFER